MFPKIPLQYFPLTCALAGDVLGFLVSIVVILLTTPPYNPLVILGPIAGTFVGLAVAAFLFRRR